MTVTLALRIGRALLGMEDDAIVYWRIDMPAPPTVGLGFLLPYGEKVVVESVVFNPDNGIYTAHVQPRIGANVDEVDGLVSRAMAQGWMGAKDFSGRAI